MVFIVRVESRSISYERSVRPIVYIVRYDPSCGVRCRGIPRGVRLVPPYVCLCARDHYGPFPCPDLL